MAYSVLVKIDADSPSNNSLNEDYAELTSSNDGSDKLDRLQITLSSSNQAFRKLKGDAIKGRFQVKELRLMTDQVAGGSVNYKGRILVCKGGKLSFNNNPSARHFDPIEPLNEVKQQPTNTSRRIFKGYYEDDIQVAIQRLLSYGDDMLKEIEREFQILRQLNNHENFIRYFCFEMDDRSEFVFIATELCLCSVEDLYRSRESVSRDTTKKILQALKTKDILFQATTGLDYLHRNHFVHRNVKPSSFLVKEVSKDQYVVKITDFRLSRQLDPDKDLSGTIASEGWIAPESTNKNQPVHSSLDVFILACFFHYILTGEESGLGRNPQHPFGSVENERLRRITNPEDSVYQSNWQPKGIRDPKAITLIKSMLARKETDRPDLSKVLQDPYFQAKEYYQIYDFPKAGLCVIFNQENFLDPKLNRKGSGMDCNELAKTFHSLGYEVQIHNDLIACDLKDEVSKLASRKYDEYGSLVICILSHGEEGIVMGSDTVPININKLKYKFSFSQCPTLYGKPKIFIIQACQGILKQTAYGFVPLSSSIRAYANEASMVSLSRRSALSKMTKDNHLNWKNLFSQGRNIPDRGPPLLDFLTIKATLPGFVALRNINYGSYFIQSLCAKLSDEYFYPKPQNERLDLEAVLRKVQKLVNAIIINPYSRQTMQWEACLSKYILFRKTDGLPPRNPDQEQKTDVRKKYFFYVPSNDSNDTTDAAVQSVDQRPRSSSL